MATHNYSITFKSLKAGTTYTVNIGGGTDAAIALNGAAQPFTTQESDDEDMFVPIRTQSGYLRIVDDGKDASGGSLGAEWWKDLIPATDTSRPITLTANGTVMWQGFMQAQNFGGTLYGNPQEREFPVQCPLTILEGTDINYQHTEIENFAYLLQRIVNTIDLKSGGTENASGVITSNGSIHINTIYIQGGADAQSWLMKRIDWQNFADEDNDGNLIARFNLFQCLEDMCRFWGWTARTHGLDLYLTCADDTSEQIWLVLTRAQLDTLAGGTEAGSTGTFSTVTLSGDIFASTSQDDYQVRGANRATVKVDTNIGDGDVLDVFNDQTVETMKDLGNQSTYIHGVIYSNDLLSVVQPYLKISCRSGYASLNIANFGQDSKAHNNVVRIKKTGGNNVTPFVEIETTYEHCFNDGFLRIYGQIYRFTDEYIDLYDDPYFIGRSYMYARIAIGKSKSNAMWWNGKTWQATPTYCRLSIGNKANNLDGNKNEFPFMYLQESQASSADWACNILNVSGLQGKLFVDLLGTSNDRVSEIDGERCFDIKDFKIEFTRNPGVIKHGSASDMIYAEDITRPSTFEYTSRNQNNVRIEWNTDGIYATENKCKFCYGEIFNVDGTFCEDVKYGEQNMRPEQHLADRVTNFWASSKRKLTNELRTEQIGLINPMNKVSIDNMTGYPIAINHEWRDDMTTLTTIQLQ